MATKNSTQGEWAIQPEHKDEPSTFEEESNFWSTKQLLDESGIDYEILSSPDNSQNGQQSEELEDSDEQSESEMSGDTPEFDGRDEPEEQPEEVEVIDEKQAKEVHKQNFERAKELANSDGLHDPLAELPGWMKTEIQHGKDTTQDLNKRGTQVIASALDLVVNSDCEISAEESDFEYCRYRATVETPNGNSYNAVADAHINESKNNKWDLERLAETRAKKRAVKWATGGGIKAFAEGSQHDVR